MLASLVALVALAQSPATPGPAWYWTDIFGQRIQIYGVQLPDGRIAWHPETATQIAPAEAERRQIAAQPKAAPTPKPESRPKAVARSADPTPNYGLLFDAMVDDGREIRASDPGTLEEVRAAIGDVQRCPPEPDEPERKPGIIERAEGEVERMLIYGLAGCLVIAGVVIVAQARSKSQA